MINKSCPTVVVAAAAASAHVFNYMYAAERRKFIGKILKNVTSAGLLHPSPERAGGGVVERSG